MGKKGDKSKAPQQQQNEQQQQQKGQKQQKKKRNQNQAVVNSVAEATRIQISQILERFRASTNREYTFEANLSSHERAVVHEVCRKMGMVSKSSGRGSQRSVSVFKKKNNVDDNKGSESLTCLTFSEESKVMLQDLFTNYPPIDEELNENVIGKSSGKAAKMRETKDDVFCKPSMSKADIAKKVELLASKMEKATQLKQVVEERSKLPIASFRDVITTTITSHQVVLISGETGCGKTTQVPQYLLDHMWSKGETSKIVCTQPRRISAVSVSERIAFERGEAIGDSVGYKIRLESKGGRQSSIVFCTNGVLLRLLISKGTGRQSKEASSKSGREDFCDITHIIVDEIHERDRFSDFMLAIVRDMLPSCPNLRLILMSATLDAERFSQYFDGCPIIRVPGFTHPVRSLYLEDVLPMLGSAGTNHLNSALLSGAEDGHELTEEDKAALDEAINLAWSSNEFDPLLDLVSSEGNPKVYNHQHSSSGLTPLMVFAGKGKVGDVCMLLQFGVNCLIESKDGITALSLAERENQLEVVEVIRNHIESALSDSVRQQQLVDKYLESINPELIDVVLLEQLLKKICVDSKDGAILVFLPGWDDINRTRERLLANSFFNNSSKFTVISLHSMVPAAEQKKVFKRPPHGCRKIVLSTNIAESAITIDDVVYVIDTGRMKEKSYDPYNNVSTLQSSWVSKANAKQREGRAGRCQPGICYHLYSKLRAAALPDFQLPEIRRMPIEELCLQIKLLDPDCKIEGFLRKTLDPPVAEAIRNAVAVLQDIGALSHNEELTELGEKLGSLPVHPSTSKMLLFAILMKCLDPALTLACASDYRDPFTLPMLAHEKKRATAAKYELASLYGGQSDQLAIIAAFECWRRAKERGDEARFCSQYFVSSGIMNMLHGMRKQLQAELVRSGMLPEDASMFSLNAHDPGVLHAVVVAGFYPMVGRLLPPKNGRRSVVETVSGAKVRLHPQSLNFNLSFKKNDDCPLVVYDEITRGDGGMHIRSCTVVGPLPLLLLATEIVVAPAKDGDSDDDNEDDSDDDNEDDDHDEGGGDEGDMDVDDNLEGENGERIMSSPDNSIKVVVDRWLYFGSTALDVAQIYCLRERLSAAILFKVTHPRKALPSAIEASMYAIACILSYDGLSGISVSSNAVDSLALKMNATEIERSGPARNRGTGPSGYLVSLMFQGMPQAPHYQKAREPGYYRHEPPNHNFNQQSSAVSMNYHQCPPSQPLASAGGSIGKSGPLGPRGDCSKRPRRNAIR